MQLLGGGQLPDPCALRGAVAEVLGRRASALETKAAGLKKLQAEAASAQVGVGVGG